MAQLNPLVLKSKPTRAAKRQSPPLAWGRQGHAGPFTVDGIKTCAQRGAVVECRLIRVVTETTTARNQITQPGSGRDTAGVELANAARTRRNVGLPVKTMLPPAPTVTAMSAFSTSAVLPALVVLTLCVTVMSPVWVPIFTAALAEMPWVLLTVPIVNASLSQ